MAPGSVNQVRELFPAGSPRPLPESQSHFKNPPDTPGALPIRSPALSRPAVRLAGGRSSHPPSRLTEAARYIAIFRLEGRVPPGRAAPGHVCSAPPVRAGTAPSRLRVPPSASPARVLRPRRRAVPKPHSPGAPDELLGGRPVFSTLRRTPPPRSRQAALPSHCKGVSRGFPHLPKPPFFVSVCVKPKSLFNNCIPKVCRDVHMILVLLRPGLGVDCNQRNLPLIERTVRARFFGENPLALHLSKRAALRGKEHIVAYFVRWEAAFCA